MASADRKSGIDIIGDVSWGTHLCQFYQTKGDLLDILVPYFKTGLENNEFCMWVTAEPLDKKSAEEAMRKGMPDFDRYSKHGQIDIIPYDEWYLKDGTFNLQRVLNGWIDKLNQALSKGYDGIRVTGDTAWLEKHGWKNFTEYEEEINNVIGKYRMIAICTYSLDKCGAPEIVDVINNHRFALIKRQGKWELIESSEHKRVEETLRESEQEYRSLFESMLNGFAYCKILVDEDNQPIDFVHLKVNDAWERAIGLKREDVIGKKITEVIPGIKESETDLISIYGKVALTGEATEFDLYFEPLEKWFTVSVYSPRKGYFVAVFEDISKRKRVERELQESEEFSSSLLDNAPNPITVINPDTSVRYVNSALEKLTDFSSAELIGRKPPYPWWPEEKQQKYSKDFEEVMRNGEHRRERFFQKKTGEQFWVEVTSTPVTHNGEFSYHLANWLDITERKQAEEALKESEAKYKELANSITDVFFAFDKDLRYTYWNKASKELTGILAKDALGKHLYDIFPKVGMMRRAKEVYQKVLRTKRPQHFINEYQLGGKNFVFEISAYPAANGLSVFVKDITERKEVEEELKQSREQLRSLSAHLQSVREQERKSIAREIHDELGQALTALKMDIFWLNKRLPKDKEWLLEKARAMSELTDRAIQTVKRISAELRPGVLDDLGLTAAVEWQAEEFQSRTGIKCQVSPKPTGIVPDQDLATQIFRIFQEALTNVSRHANATRVKVSLEERAGKLVLKVSDNGKGITQEQITNPKSFGLMGISERARSQGGKAKISGIKGKGTTVTVTISLDGRKETR